MHETLKRSIRRSVAYRVLSKITDRKRTRKILNAFYRAAPGKPVQQTDLLSVVVPVFNANERYLTKLHESFLQNACPSAELIFVDDGSDSVATKTCLSSLEGKAGSRVITRNQNGGISAALNDGIKAAKGRWITFLDHDDMIAPHGLNQIAAALSANPNTQFLYTDEALIDGRSQIIGAFCKPAFDPVLLSGVNYINHFSVFITEKLREIGPLLPEFDGSQDYEILLRYLTQVAPDKVLHLPYPAYWWRRTNQTYSRVNLQKSLAAARKALRTHVKPGGFDANVGPSPSNAELHRLRFKPSDGTWPSVGIIIPNRDAPALIKSVLRDLYEKNDYPNFKIVVVDDGSSDPKTLRIYEEICANHENISVLRKDRPFNFAQSINEGMAALDTDHFLLLNNDIAVRDDHGWLKEMVSCMAYDRTGIVGAKLLFIDGTLQHAGVVVGQRDLAGHWFYGAPADTPGPMGRLCVRNSMMAVTGAAMLVSRDCATQVGTWDADNFAVAFNDVDYCLRAHDLGFRIVWTPHACLTHTGSATRAAVEDADRTAREEDSLKRIHRTDKRMDPAFSPFFARTSTGARLCKPAATPTPRGWFSE